MQWKNSSFSVEYLLTSWKLSIKNMMEEIKPVVDHKTSLKRENWRLIDVFGVFGLWDIGCNEENPRFLKFNTGLPVELSRLSSYYKKLSQ